jgi:hypothetical protein
MSQPTRRLDPELATALQGLERAFGPLQVLDVHPTPPQRRPVPTPAAAEPQPSLFDPAPDPEPEPVSASTSTSAGDPDSHLPPHRRWRTALRNARPLSPASTPSTWRYR